MCTVGSLAFASQFFLFSGEIAINEYSMSWNCFDLNCFDCLDYLDCLYCLDYLDNFNNNRYVNYWYDNFIIK